MNFCEAAPFHGGQFSCELLAGNLETGEMNASVLKRSLAAKVWFKTLIPERKKKTKIKKSMPNLYPLNRFKSVNQTSD